MHRRVACLRYFFAVNVCWKEYRALKNEDRDELLKIAMLGDRVILGIKFSTAYCTQFVSDQPTVFIYNVQIGDNVRYP